MRLASFHKNGGGPSPDRRRETTSLRLYSIVLLSSTSRAVWANFVLLSILFFCK